MQKWYNEKIIFITAILIYYVFWKWIVSFSSCNNGLTVHVLFRQISTTFTEHSAFWVAEVYTVFCHESSGKRVFGAKKLLQLNHPVYIFSSLLRNSWRIGLWSMYGVPYQYFDIFTFICILIRTMLFWRSKYG